MERPIVELADDQIHDLEWLLKSQPRVYCVIMEDAYKVLVNSSGSRVHVLARWPLLKVNLRIIFGRADTPHVILVSNYSD